MGVYTRSVPYGAGLLYCRDPEKLREAGFLDFGIQTRPAASLGSENVLQAQNTRRKKDGIHHTDGCRQKGHCDRGTEKGGREGAF